MSQPIANKDVGRRSFCDFDLLLRFEALWVDTFRGLRDGNPEVEARTIAGVASFVKRSAPHPEELYISISGEKPRIIRQSKFDSTPEENRRWRSLVKEEADKYEQNRLTWKTYTARPVPGERQLWEALKRANTAAQVRRICTRSKVWLKPRLELPSGSFAEYWFFRRVLYRDAEKFCRAKLDPRYPARDSRASGDYRRIEYLSRAMAGLTARIAPSTAVKILRRLKHLDECRCWRCTRMIAPRYRRSLADLLMSGDWFK